jgi:hypothetical protein
MIRAVHQYLDRQGDLFLKGVFERFADFSSVSGAARDVGDCSRQSKSKCKASIRTNGLQNALLELGVHMEMEKVEALMDVMDLDENGCLDFEEFKRAVLQPPTQLEQWASMLPLAGMLARCLPVSGGMGDQPLRDFSKLGEDEINAAVEVFGEGLKRLLFEAKATSKKMFESTDEKAKNAAKDSANGVSAGRKFKTFKMSTGTVDDFYKGVSSRVGTLFYLHLDA